MSSPEARDPVVLAVRLGREAGLDVDSLLAQQRPAGAWGGPLTGALDLQPAAVALCDLALRAAAGDHAGPARLGLTHEGRLIAICRLAGAMLPPTAADPGRHWHLGATVDDDLGDLPADSHDLDRLADELASALADYDSGDWAGAQRLAAATADLHDAALTIEALTIEALRSSRHHTT